jgi:hypothetical protein
MEVPATVYSSYTEAQKRATKKYRENNKDKVNLQRKKYYEERKAKDPSFLEQKRNKARLYYQKKKEEKAKEKEDKEGKVKVLSLEIPIDVPLDNEGIEMVNVNPEPENPEIELPPFPHLSEEPVNQFIIESSSEPVIEKPKRKPRVKKVNLKLEDLSDIELKPIESVSPLTPPIDTPILKKNKKYKKILN